MSNVWSYEGRKVVVTGGGGAGMGAAAVTELASLGAEIHVLDLKEPPVEVASYQNVDLKDPDAAAKALESIGGDLDALFNCAGLPGSPFSDIDTMLVNFAAMRWLAELCAARMSRGGAICNISSTAGSAYLQNIEKWMPLVMTESFAEAKEWCESHLEEIAGGYVPSKESICVWTMWAGMSYAHRGIRLNTICPGPTDTPMMPSFEGEDGERAGLVDLFAQGLGRRSTPEEQAYPMIFLNSRAASYIAGENVTTDGGTVNAIATGALTLDFNLASAD